MPRTQKDGRKIRFQLGWSGLTALVVSCLCVLLWVFILGFWVGQKLVGKGITQAPDTAVTSLATPQPKEPLLAPPEMQAPEEAAKTAGEKEDRFPAAEIPTEPVREEPAAPAVAEMPVPETVTEPVPEPVTEQAVAPPAEQAPEPETAKVAAEQAATPAPKVQAPEKTTTYFVLQIAAYREQERADRECRHWKDKGYPTQVRTVDLGPKKGVWHRVYVGHFRAVDQATAFAKRLAQDEGLKSYVVPLRD